MRGDFDFTAEIVELAPAGAYKLNGAAEAVLNVRDGLEFKAPTNSLIAGRMTGRTTFMGRFHWKHESPPNGVGTRRVESKYWYWRAEDVRRRGDRRPRLHRAQRSQPRAQEARRLPRRDSPLLKQAARCVFRNVSLVQR